MYWSQGFFRLGVVALSYWWGVWVLLRWGPSLSAQDREDDERWLQEYEAWRQKRGLRAGQSLPPGSFVYLVLTVVFVGAIVWVIRGFT